MFHGGGLVGAPGPARLMPELAFVGAPRYATGGLAGLRPTLGNPTPDMRIPVTQRELAEMCNCSHNAVNAELGRMSQRGWVELAYGQVRLLDPESILRSFQSGR